MCIVMSVYVHVYNVQLTSLYMYTVHCHPHIHVYSKFFSRNCINIGRMHFPCIISDLGYILHVHVHVHTCTISHAPFHISASPPGHKDTPGQQLFGQYVGLEVIQCLQCSLTDVLREGEGEEGGGEGRSREGSTCDLTVRYRCTCIRGDPKCSSICYRASNS